MSRRKLPSWIWQLALAANHCSLDYDESFVPEHVWNAWKDSLADGSQASEIVLKFLSECDPVQAHHFLHCTGHYDEHPREWQTVLERADCDQATAMMYVAYFWGYLEEPEDGRWMEESTKELLSSIRNRAWSNGFKTFEFGLPEQCLLELDEMRRVLVANKDHHFSLPGSFLPKTKTEALYYKLRDRILPRSWTANSTAPGHLN